MRKLLFSIVLVSLLGSCNLSKNYSTAWHYPNHVVWPEKRIERKTEVRKQSDKSTSDSTKAAELYASSNPNEVPVIGHQSGIVSKAPLSGSIEKLEQFKSNLIRKLESNRRFQRLNQEKKDTLIQRIRNVSPEDKGPAIDTIEEPNERLKFRLKKMGIGSISLSTIGTFFSPLIEGLTGALAGITLYSVAGAVILTMMPGLFFGLPAIIMGFFVLKLVATKKFRRMALAAIILGFVLVALSIALTIVIVPFVM